MSTGVLRGQRRPMSLELKLQVVVGCLMSVPGPELRPHRAIADKLLPGSHLSNPQSCSIFIVYPGTTKWGQERLSCS